MYSTLGPVDCVWSSWSDWSSCSKSCDEGIKTKTRTKLTEASNGGSDCTGEVVNAIPCNEGECPGIQITTI